MGIGGKINRPRTELKKKLFKRRRELARGARRQKRRPPPRDAAPALWGKRRRKMLKRLRVALRSGEPVKGPEGGRDPMTSDPSRGHHAAPVPEETGGKKPGAANPPDVEMEEAAAAE